MYKRQEPSQPQRITSGLNTNFNLSPNYSFYKSYHKSCFLEPIYIPREVNTGTCLQPGENNLFCGPTRELCVNHSQHGKSSERFGKNASEWTGKVEISKEEIPAGKSNMYGYILTYSRLALKGARLSSVFPPDGTLISASAAPHCEANKAEIRSEEQSEKAESCRENFWNEIQLKGP